MRDASRAQLGLNAGFAQHEDFVLGRGGFQDEGDVDGGAVGGGEDFFERGGDAHGHELRAVVGAGFGGIVGYEDELFASRAEQFEDWGGVGEDMLARPKDACPSRNFQ